ncbi:hypothetical protein JNJ66_07560 [Candidatus Saccharibacteria bacterium]|nr:hypothetical protein [Candidatus Saccharibacteria bacterium]
MLAMALNIASIILLLWSHEIWQKGGTHGTPDRRRWLVVLGLSVAARVAYCAVAQFAVLEALVGILALYSLFFLFAGFIYKTYWFPRVRRWLQQVRKRNQKPLKEPPSWWPKQ